MSVSGTISILLAVVVVVIVTALVSLYFVARNKWKARFGEYISFEGCRCFSGDYQTDCKQTLELKPQWSAYPTSLKSLMSLISRFEVGIIHGDEELYTTQISNDAVKLLRGPGSSIPLCTVYRDGSHLIVACRGTADAYDWGQNAKVKQTAPFPSVSSTVAVHTGFLNEYKRIEAEFILSLNDSSAPVKQLSLVGHSMGCGVAALCALYTVFNRPDVAVSGLFVASPRIGNADMVNALSRANIVTLVNVADPFPTLPPALTPTSFFRSGGYYDYRHMGKVLSFNEYGPTVMNMHSVYVYWKFLTSIAE